MLRIGTDQDLFLSFLHSSQENPAVSLFFSFSPFVPSLRTLLAHGLRRHEKFVPHPTFGHETPYVRGRWLQRGREIACGVKHFDVKNIMECEGHEITFLT